MYLYTVCVLFLGVLGQNQAAALDITVTSSQDPVAPLPDLNIIPGAEIGKYENISGHHFPCPEPEAIAPCKCSYNGYGNLILDCSDVTSNEELGQSLSAYFPYSEFSQFLIKDNNNITQLGDITRGIRCYSVFLQVPTLKSVSPNFLLQSYSTLETLIINKGLVFSPEFSFYNLRSMSMLRTLNFENNYLLHHLPQIVSNTIEHLDLSSNGLTTLSNLVFSGAPALRFVALSHNQLSSLPAHTVVIRRTRDTYTYGFAYNKIHYIDPAAFYIEAADNHTQVIVDLAHNQLRALDIRVFAPLVDRTGPNTRLYAAGNPFTCDCSVAWLFKRSAHGSSFFTAIADAAACEDGTKFTDLKIADYMKCFRVGE